MMTKTDAYNRGFASGKRAKGNIRQRMESQFKAWQTEAPALAQTDLAQEFVRLDRERLANPPSYTRFPEARGWPDIVMAERKGFADASGCGPAELAFRFNST